MIAIPRLRRSAGYSNVRISGRKLHSAGGDREEEFPFRRKPGRRKIRRHSMQPRRMLPIEPRQLRGISQRCSPTLGCQPKFYGTPRAPPRPLEKLTRRQPRSNCIPPCLRRRLTIHPMKNHHFQFQNRLIKLYLPGIFGCPAESMLKFRRTTRSNSGGQRAHIPADNVLIFRRISVRAHI